MKKLAILFRTKKVGQDVFNKVNISVGVNRETSTLSNVLNVGVI